MKVEVDPHNLGPEEVIIQPVLHTTPAFWKTVAILMAFVLVGAWAYTRQLIYGLSVTGLGQPVYWGMYIINFVFFIGISHAGTLISAILRATNAEWRRPITRSAEAITVLVIFIGAAQPIIDMGRPDRWINIFRTPHMASPLMWDVVSISAYLIFSLIYFYFPLIPDLAILRERVGPPRRWFYSLFSLGWKGTEKQYHLLEKLIGIMMIVIIPIAVSVHTVVSWVFAMTIQPFWHSTIFGPFFVAGAIFSGLGALIIAMAVIRKTYHLESYFKDIHFDYLGLMLLFMSVVWLYFIIAEHLTSFYGAEPQEMRIFWEKLTGRFAWAFWSMVVCNFVIPMAVLARKKTRTVVGTVIASSFVLAGMWLERFQIVIPTLVNPRLPYPRGGYVPTIYEVLIAIGCFALFILLYVIFARVFPVVSIWEVKAGRTEGIEATVKRLESYQP
jgi:molybdopterin-containing oxidoreductase family membrane subunit